MFRHQVSDQRLGNIKNKGLLLDRERQMFRMDDISSIKWKNETCSDTKSAPNDWKIKHKGLLLEREKTKTLEVFPPLVAPNLVRLGIRGLSEPGFGA